jgi:hypothetical protein
MTNRRSKLSSLAPAGQLAGLLHPTGELSFVELVGFPHVRARCAEELRNFDLCLLHAAELRAETPGPGHGAPYSGHRGAGGNAAAMLSAALL